MTFQQNQLFKEQVVGLGPTGLTLDFPFYYDMRPTGVGTLHLRRGAAVGSSAYSIRPGWHADLEQAYNNESGTSEGVLEWENAGFKQSGLRLRHNQRFDPALTGNFFAELPNQRDLFVTSQLERDFRRFRLSNSTYTTYSPGVFDAATGTHTPGGGVLRDQLFATGAPRVFWGVPKLRYSLSAGTLRQSWYGFFPAQRGLLENDNVGLRLFTTPLVIGRQTTLTQSVSGTRGWLGGNAIHNNLYNGAGSGMSYVANTAVTRSLGALGLDAAYLRLQPVARPPFPATLQRIGVLCARTSPRRF